jgi:hypothetical protein
MSEDSETVAEARRVYLKLQSNLLAATPLGEMRDWLVGGRVPTAADLRAQGFEFAAPPGNLRLARKAFIRQWGFSIPCAESVAELVQLSPLVEIGAGSGYWSALVAGADGDVIATDAIAEGSPGYGLTVGLHTKIEALDAVEAVRRYPERNVFCSWPTQDADWCAEAAQAMCAGRRLALVGQPRGGETGSPRLFDVLETDFTEERRIVIPQFPGVQEVFTVHRRI